MKKLLHEIVFNVYDLLFPKLCPGCKTEIIHEKKLLCWLCHLTIPLTYFPPKSNVVFEKFPENLPLESLYVLCAFYPKGMAERLIYAMKYEHQPQLAVFLGQMFGRYISNYSPQIKGLIPVPLHPKREQKRGYNQALKIAEGMAKELKCPVNKALIRIKNTPQLARIKADREAVLENAFAFSFAKKLLPGHYLLVDDVLTTGATLKACAKVLLAEKDICLSIASLAYRI